jgi:ATP phosphoribosyltransferase
VKKALKIGLPAGSLKDSTFDLFARAGFSVNTTSRSYFPVLDDPELEAVMFRAQEMSRYVEDGVLDCGLTGKDWIDENGSDVVEVAELVYSKATTRPTRWVLAVPEASPVQKPEDLAGRLVATELVNVTRKWFASRKIDVKVEFSWGATEVKAELVGAIVEVTETGSSLKANKLRIVETLMTSTTRFVASKAAMADEWKREKIENIAILLKGAINARHKVGMKLNCSRENLSAVLAILSGKSQRSPTVSPLAEANWAAVEVIVEDVEEREMIPRLKRAGATGIITYPLNKVIP